MKSWQIFLLPFSWLYGAVVLLRNYCYDVGILKIERVNIPVISIGNLTAGGTGKTPFVEYCVRYFLQTNKKVAVISRGYKRQSSGLQVISADDANRGDARLMGDEPFQIARKFPQVTVISDNHRARAAKVAVEQHAADVVILDDGFQHRSLARDLDIVMIDGMKSLKKDQLLPAGLRREPLTSLRRAQVLAYTKLENASRPMEQFSVSPETINLKVTFHPKRLVDLNGKSPHDLSSFRGKLCVAFCGIGSPESFHATVQSLEVRLERFLTFQDHHQYTDSDIQKIISASEKHQTEIILTTEKDFVRLSAYQRTQFANRALYYVEIEACIVEGESAFHQLLDSRTRR